MREGGSKKSKIEVSVWVSERVRVSRYTSKLPVNGERSAVTVT